MDKKNNQKQFIDSMLYNALQLNGPLNVVSISTVTTSFCYEINNKTKKIMVKKH